jgi:tetratricopeptide (TPR) repeat protein
VDARLAKDEIFLTFTQANDAFAKANQVADDTAQAQTLYQKAIAGYERIIEAGEIHNAKLYYNLANSYLLTDDLGRAILNYRRAERLNNSNPDIHKNLNYARSKRIDQFPVTAQKKILERLFFWHYDFSMNTRFLIGGIAFAVFCIWLLLRIWVVRWTAVVPVCSVTILVSLAMTVSVAIEQYVFSTHRSGVITSASVIARQGDGENYPQSFTEPLHAGVEFDVIEQRPSWFHIELPNGQDAWIPAQSADLI